MRDASRVPEKWPPTMRSLYVNSVLHERDKAEASIEAVLAIARKAKDLGTEIIVTTLDFI